jgi:iron(III) transport system substrate-binding protein
MKRNTGFTARLLLTLTLAFPLAASASNEVNVYSYRQPFLIKPLFDAFTRESGIKVNVVFADKGLAERLKHEGRNSPADLVFTVDIGRLMEVVDADVVQSLESEVLNRNIPTQYRHPDGLWFGLTTRTRSIFASRDRADLSKLRTYEDLASPHWKGKVCTRSGKHAYNIALIASMIAHHGEAGARKWLQGLKANLAQKPQGGDRDQIKAIKEGVCDVALGNNYYYGVMLNDSEQAEAAAAVQITFPNQTGSGKAGRGTHVNISGMALTKSAPNKANAIKLMEFLSERVAQKIYAEQNFEYPVNPDVEPSGLLQSWGTFKADQLPLAEIAKLRKRASELVDEVAFDQ